MKCDHGFWKSVAGAWARVEDTGQQERIREVASQLVRSAQEDKKRHDTKSRIPSALDAIFGGDDDDDFI